MLKPSHRPLYRWQVRLMKALAPLTLLPLLGACQGHNPYTAQAASMPPAPAQPIYYPDANSYPAAPRDYARYRTWSWHSLPAGSPWANSEQLQEALSQALDQRGLRPRQAGSDLQARVELREEQRLRQVSLPHDAYDPRYGHWPRPPQQHSYSERVVVVHIELFDSRDGQRVWHSGAEMPANVQPQQQLRALHQAMAEALSAFPPH